MDAHQLVQLAGPLWRALADPSRRRILDLLRERPLITGEIAWCDKEIIPHYNVGGVTKFAFITGGGVLFPTVESGADPAPEGPATFPTGPVLVIGAAGCQGGSVLRHLLEHGWPVRALTSRPDSPAARPLAAAGITAGRGAAPDQAR